MTERLYLIGEITEQVAYDFLIALDKIHARAPKAPIEVVINSQGGGVADGMSVFSELEGLSERGGGTHRITTKVRGMAGSMATMVLQAGDWRVMGRGDFTVWHEARMEFHSAPLSFIRDEIAQWEAHDRLLASIIRERSTLTWPQIRELHGPSDRIVLADEALQFGLIDEIA